MEEVRVGLEGIKEEEEEAIGNMEEHFSGTEKYERMEEIRDILENGIDEIESLTSDS